MANVQETFTGSAFVEKGFDLWDFPAREYNWNQARWVTPDPAGINAVDPTNPQSWNRYAYVLNNPLALIDPSGLAALVPLPPPYSVTDGNCTIFVTFSYGSSGGIVANISSTCGGDPGGGTGGGAGPQKIGTPKTSSQCSIYQDGSTTGNALSKICQAFPNGPISNQIRGCLQGLYSPGIGYAPFPLIIPFMVPGGGTDLDSVVPGTGVHLACFANAAGLP
jgi:RHS repeat-associated protein